MNAPEGVAWFSVTVLCLAALPVGAVPVSTVDVTAASLAVTGSQNVSLANGAVHVDGGSLPERFRLDAERLELDHAWIRGQQANGGTGSPLLTAETERGGQTSSFEQASLGIEEVGDDATQILAYPADGSSSIEAHGDGFHVFDRLDVEHLTAVGESPGSQQAGETEPVGFWFSPPEGWLVGHGSDRAVVQGTFSLFVNNATVTVEEDGEVAWKNRTGYWEEENTAGMASYERHLLLVHARNATLRLSADDAVDVLGPRLETGIEGAVMAEDATGRLQLEGRSLAVHEDPLRLEGSGRLQVTETAPAVDRAGLDLATLGGSGFDLRGGEPIEPASTVAPLGGAGSPWSLAVGFALLAGAFGVYRSGIVGGLLRRWRSHRYTKHMARGRELARARDYEAAASCFDRARRAHPAKGLAWYHHAMALLEEDQPAAVLDLVDEARDEQAVIDELDFLELEVEAARRTEDVDRCRQALAQLADGSTMMARSLVHDLGIGDEMLGPELVARLRPDEDEEAEGLPGYV